MAESSQRLHMAVWKNDENSFISCLEKGEDLNKEDKKGMKPLHVAVLTSNDKFVKLLLSNKTQRVEIDSKTWCYLTLISNEKIVTHLLHHHHGPIKDLSDDNGYSLLHHAVINRKSRLIGLFCVLGCYVNSRSNNGSTPLHLSAIANDLEIMDRLLYHGADTNLKTADGKTVLYYAVRHRHKQFVSLLIKKSNVDINRIVDNSGSSALHIAVENNDEIMIKLLLKNKANVMCKDRNGRNLLHVAAECGHENWIEFFLKKGIPVNSVANDNSTPLIIALQNRKENIADILFAHGANVNIRNNHGLSPLCAALQYKCTELVERLILLRANVNNLTLENSSVLHFAVKYCDVNVVKCLLQHGAKLGVKDCLGQNELHIAAKYNNSHMLQYLLKLGMNVNEVTLDRCTALHYAVSSNLSKNNNVAVLINHGVVIDAENESGDTALNIVCRSKDENNVYNVVEQLLTVKADLNHIGSDKKRPLHSCIESAIIGTAYLLAKHGAVLNKVNARGDSVLQLLIRHSCGCACTRGEFIKEFLKYGADLHNVNQDGETVLHTSLMYEMHENVHEIKNFFNMGVQLSCNRLGESALHLAIKLSKTKSTTEEIVEFLLEKDVPVDDVTSNGCNVLHYAAQYSDNLNIIKLLLDKIKPSKYYLINRKNKEGKTPLHITSALGLNSFVEVLLKYTADINSKDNNNDTALYHAIKGNHVETVKFLLRKGASTTDKNKDGSNAYDLAKLKNDHIYQLILNHKFW